MCFRPAAVELDKKCPACQATNDINATHCKECGAELPEGPKFAPPGASAAPSAPGAPAAPGAPKAPGAPAAPSAPKAPGK